MERYEAYKDSGASWIGEIPTGWDSPVAAKRVVLSRKNGNWGEEPSESDEGKICLRAADFDYEKLSFKPNDMFVKRLYPGTVFDSIRLFTGDLLVEKSGGGEKVPVGRAILYRGGFEAGYSNFMERIRVDCSLTNPVFFFYWWTSCYQSGRFMPFFSQTTGIQNLNSAALLTESSIALPPQSEQQAIADWLDEKTAEIDGLVGDCEREIELLQEYRKSVISEAVTKGLDPDAPRKDSGVEWIGEIPEEWMVVRIKYFATLESGATPDRSRPEYWGAGYSWFKTGELQNNILENAEEEITDFGFHNSSTKLFPEGTLLIAMYGQGKTRGMTALLAKPSCTNQACAGVSVFDGSVNPRYLQYFMIASYDEIRSVAQGSGQPNLSIDLLKDWSVVRPSINLQQEVVAYLDTKTAEIDTLIEARQSMVEKLKEYRKSIISEAVTGKFKVPEVHAHA